MVSFRDDDPKITSSKHVPRKVSGSRANTASYISMTTPTVGNIEDYVSVPTSKLSKKAKNVMTLNSATNIENILANLKGATDLQNGMKSENAAINHYFSTVGRKKIDTIT